MGDVHGGLPAPELLADYEYFCRRFHPVPFREFIHLWLAADELMADALAAGYEPSDVPNLLIDPETTCAARGGRTRRRARPSRGR